MLDRRKYNNGMLFPFSHLLKRFQATFGLAVLLSLLAVLWSVSPAPAEELQYEPNRFGLGVLFGSTYNAAEDLNFVQAQFVALFDYDRVWKHRAPDPLRFKVEADIGSTTDPFKSLMVSANILALYYLERLSFKKVRPYGEAGIGIIYTDFQLEGQGSRINFNPLLGAGVDFSPIKGPPFFAAFRLHHISNAGLHEDNRGLNSWVILVGRYF